MFIPCVAEYFYESERSVTEAISDPQLAYHETGSASTPRKFL